jgi:hypothetical protein
LHRKQNTAQIVICCWDAQNYGGKISEITDSPNVFSFASSLHDVILTVLKFAQSGTNAPYCDVPAKNGIEAAS